MQGAQGTIGQMLVEVRHHTDDMGQAGACVERRASLVIDQHEREVIGARTGGQPHDQSSQQFALASTGCSRHQGVRAIPVEVDIDYPVACHTDHCAWWRIDARGDPGRSNRRGLVRRQQRKQVDVVRNPARSAEGVLRVDQATQTSDQSHGAALAHAEATRLNGQRGQRSIGVPPRVDRPAQIEQRRADMRNPVIGLDEHDQRHRPIGDEDPSQWACPRCQQLRLVRHDHEMRMRHQVGSGDGFQQFGFTDHCHQTGRSCGVRQVLEPSPAGRFTRHDDHAHVSGPTTGSKLQQDRTDSRPRPMDVAPNSQTTRVTDIGEQWQVSEHRHRSQASGRPGDADVIESRAPGDISQADRNNEGVGMSRSPRPQVGGQPLDRTTRRRRSRIVLEVVGNEAGALRFDRRLELARVLPSSVCLASATLEETDPVASPRAECNERSDDTEHKEHRLVQQDCDQS